ncbi:MAG: ABC transporter permease, partial [Oligoflexia bacterium]|nr:ABC transporter permease [Oligoflexia bacterium]
MRLLFHRPTFIFSVGFVGMIVVVSLAASWIAPFDFATQDLDRVLLTPNSINWLGTDQLGRDLFSRLIFGARVSLTVALASAVVGMFLGIGLGALAGYVGGWTDRLIMRSIDIFQSLPQFVIMVLISSYFHDWGAHHDFEVGAVLGMFVALCLVSWASIARLVRGQVSHLKTMPFVESAVVIGGTDLTVLMK